MYDHKLSDTVNLIANLGVNMQTSEIPVIETTNLTKYYGKNRGIENINLSINKGEIFGFIGPNGSGKSTTIRTLLGLLFPTNGSGKIFNMDIVKDSKEIKKKVGFMPSDINYYDKMDAEELLKYSARIYGVNADNKIKELAEIFELDLKKKIFDLSMGNKKKVSILQSLIHKPELLILDEPTNGLDPLMQSRFFNILFEENNKGTTIFFSSHTLSVVQKMCKRIAIIKNGTIIKIEDIEEMQKKLFKKVNIDFEKDIEEKELNMAGVKYLEIDKNKNAKFLFSGDINFLMDKLNNLNITDITIEEPSLEEVFMHYYENGSNS